jgi:hypothetical protein
VHFNCRQPTTSAIDHYLFPLRLPRLRTQRHTLLRVPWSLLVSPPPLAARFTPPRVRSGLRASTHSCSAFPCALGLVPATANAGWRAITGTKCRRAPSAARTSGTRLGLCDGAGAAKHGESHCHKAQCKFDANAFFSHKAHVRPKNSPDCNMVYSYTKLGKMSTKLTYRSAGYPRDKAPS